MAELVDLSDGELTDLWAHGSRQAGQELVKRHFENLRGFLVNSVPDQDVADVLQQVFLAIAEALQSFRHESSFRTLLYAIAHKKVADYFRKKYKDQGRFDPSSQSVEDIMGLKPSSAVAQLQAASRLNACLRKLSVDDRELLELRYWHDMEPTQLSVIFELPATTVRTKLFRAREKLARLLESCRDEADHDEVTTELEEQLRELGRRLGVPRSSA